MRRTHCSEFGLVLSYRAPTPRPLSHFAQSVLAAIIIEVPSACISCKKRSIVGLTRELAHDGPVVSIGFYEIIPLGTVPIDIGVIAHRQRLEIEPDLVSPGLLTPCSVGGVAESRLTSNRYATQSPSQSFCPTRLNHGRIRTHGIQRHVNPLWCSHETIPCARTLKSTIDSHYHPTLTDIVSDTTVRLLVESSKKANFVWSKREWFVDKLDTLHCMVIRRLSEFRREYFERVKGSIEVGFVSKPFSSPS